MDDLGCLRRLLSISKYEKSGDFQHGHGTAALFRTAGAVLAQTIPGDDGPDKAHRVRTGGAELGEPSFMGRS